MFLHARRWAIAALAGMTACAPAFETRVRDVDLDTQRIAALPAHVVVSELDVVGHVTPNAEWTRSATVHVNAALAGWVQAHGGRTFGRADVAATSVPYDLVARWIDEVLESISNAMARGTEHRSVSDWQLRQPLSDWRTALGADYVLGFRAWDAHETAGLTATNIVLKGAAGHALQVGIACMLSLADGRVVACSRATAVNVKRRYLLINDANLESPDTAQTAVEYILDGLLPPQDGARR